MLEPLTTYQRAAMDSWCKGCTHHHNAGHPKGSALTKYNDWCCRYGHFAKRMVSHCKLHKGRTLTRDAVPTSASDP